VFLKAAAVTNPAFKMTFGNMSEVVFLLLLPWFLKKWGVKWVVVAGMCAWIVRYALFAAGAPDAVAWMILGGILLHGLCYDFVYIAGQIYLDRVASPAIRARAQGLFVLVSYGVGQGIGTLAAGYVFNHTVTGQGQEALLQWQHFWIIPVVFASMVTAVFLLGLKNKEQDKDTPAAQEQAPVLS
ncbi:MAG TPA: MFS transporter, partial [Chitinophaga sp.]